MRKTMFNMGFRPGAYDVFGRPGLGYSLTDIQDTWKKYWNEYKGDVPAASSLFTGGATALPGNLGPTTTPTAQPMVQPPQPGNPTLAPVMTPATPPSSGFGITTSVLVIGAIGLGGVALAFILGE